jgi:hypothetical protein
MGISHVRKRWSVRLAVPRHARRGVGAISPRHPVDFTGRVSVAGQSGQSIRVSDLSARGSCISGGPSLTVGPEGPLSLDGPLRFTVRSVENDTANVAVSLDATATAALDPMRRRATVHRAA